MNAYYQWLEFPTGNRPYGGGGWSRNARHRPLPEIRQGTGEAVQSGKSWVVNGVRKLKLNLWNLDTGECVKNDYSDLTRPTELNDALVRSIMAANISR